MATVKAHNKNNAGVKRILREAAELAADPSTDYTANPLETDIFEWHCTMRGPSNTEFEGGVYHFRIILPAEYPFRPPSIVMLTPSGRFECGSKICISFTSYHEELWQPAWGVRTAIIGLQGFFPLKGEAAVGLGAVDYPPSERKRLAALSRDWTCPHCQQKNVEILPDPPECDKSTSPSDQLAPSVAPTTESPPSPAESTPHPILSPASDAPEVHVMTQPSPAPASAILSPTRTYSSSHTVYSSSSSRPPLFLDAAICVLLVLVAALIFRRFL